MKLKFKVQSYQTDAVDSVVNCFAGQPKSTGTTYRIDPGAEVKVGEHIGSTTDDTGFRNSDIALAQTQLLENIRSVQQHQNLPVSNTLVSSKVCPVNLDIEKCKIECARKFFAKITSNQVKYDVVDSYGKLMALVQ